MKTTRAFLLLGALFLAASSADARPGAWSIVGDPAYEPAVANPTYTDPNTAPLVLFDASRDNIGGVATRFGPLGRLLEADGYRVAELTEPIPKDFTACLLNGCPYLTQWRSADVLVLGSPQAPIGPEEIQHLVADPNGTTLAQALVRNLLIVTEDPHNVEALTDALGVDLKPRLFHFGDWGFPTLRFTHRLSDGSLAAHLIQSGRGGSETVSEVRSFGGLGIETHRLFPPDAWRPLLRAPDDALFLEVENGEIRLKSAAGLAQMVAIQADLPHVKHEQRIVISTDGAITTALAGRTLDDGSTEFQPFQGFQLPEAAQNQQFALNLMHWLDGSLVEPQIGQRPPGCTGQCADVSFQPDVPNPAFAAGSGPRVLIDSAHENLHTISDQRMRYLGFARVLRADGYVVQDSPLRFDDPALQAELQDTGIVVIANAGQVAANAPNALSDAEAAALLDWVRSGGALWLIADHPPYTSSYANLASALGFAFSASDNSGVLAQPARCAPWVIRCFTCKFAVRASDPESWEGRLNIEHPVVQGRDASEFVQWVENFRGSAVQIMDGARAGVRITPVGTVAESAFFHAADGSGNVPAAGFHTALAIELGAGRVFVATEAGGLTAQVAPTGEAVGLSVPEAAFNQQYVLNTAHWLTGMLR